MLTWCTACKSVVTSCQAAEKLRSSHGCIVIVASISPCLWQHSISVRSSQEGLLWVVSLSGHQAVVAKEELVCICRGRTGSRRGAGKENALTSSADMGALARAHDVFASS